MRRAALLVLAVLALLGGCVSSSTPLMSDQDRCMRYGGLWIPQTGDCRGGGAGGM